MKVFLIILAVLCIAAATAMYVIGNDSSNLSELNNFWYLPLPLAVFALIGAFKKIPITDD